MNTERRGVRTGVGVTTGNMVPVKESAGWNDNAAVVCEIEAFRI